MGQFDAKPEKAQEGSMKMTPVSMLKYNLSSAQAEFESGDPKRVLGFIRKAIIEADRAAELDRTHIVHHNLSSAQAELENGNVQQAQGFIRRAISSIEDLEK